MTPHIHLSTAGTSTTIEVVSEPSTSPLPSSKEIPQLFADLSSPFNTRTSLTVRGPFGSRTIELYWRVADHGFNHMAALVVEATGVLFLGAHTLLAVLDLRSGALRSEHPLHHFWAVDYTHGCVLVRSELQCFVFAHDGTLSASVPVDPPWEETEDDRGISFQSPVYGSRFLAWVR